MKIKGYNSFGPQDNKELIPLIIPDNVDQFAVRYTWYSHKDNNTEFIKNYFINKNTKGLNIRKQTEHLNSLWENHNAIFNNSAKNGDLVWRVKVHNKYEETIDFVEVWRNKEILIDYFGPVKIVKSVPGWTSESSTKLSEAVFNAGFISRTWLPFQSISKKLASTYYDEFLRKSFNKDNCIINTPYKYYNYLNIE
jgi:hypothetical protein